MDDSAFANLLSHWRGSIGSAMNWEDAHGKGTVFRVKTARGETYVLKEAEREFAGRSFEERLKTERELARHLRAEGVPVAVPILTDDASLFARFEERIYVLSPSLPWGYSPEDERTYFNVGAGIGRLHRALATFPHDIPSWRMDLPPRIFEVALPRIRALIPKEKFAPLEEAIRKSEDDLRRSLSDLPERRIHGDCHGGNLLMLDGEVTGFIDMDHLPVGPRIYDPAYYLADMAKNRIDDAARLTFWLSLFDRVIAGYESEIPLVERERSSIWRMMLAIQILFVETFAQSHNAAHVDKNLRLFHWIYERKEEIIRGAMRAGNG